MRTLLTGLGAALLVSAAAAGAAVAATHTVNLNGYCDEFTVTSQDGGSNDWSFVSMNTDCDDGFGFGGVSESTELNGKFINMGGVLFAFGDLDLWALQLESPLKTGYSWDLFKSTDGVHFKKVNSGTYSLVGKESIRPHGKPASQGP